jgi:hypothetical protein
MSASALLATHLSGAPPISSKIKKEEREMKVFKLNFVFICFH